MDGMEEIQGNGHSAAAAPEKGKVEVYPVKVEGEDVLVQIT